MNTVSFAQFETDRAILSLFPQGYIGRFIDIGANHPIIMSNTALFYQAGWRGIAIDPVISKIALFSHYRPEDIAIRTAVGSHDGSIEFHELEEDTWSTLSLSEAKSRGVPFTTSIVPIRTVATILSDLGMSSQHFDFVSIDVEGAEREILEGCPWESGFRPSVIVLEACEPCSTIPSDGEWIHILDAHGYRHVMTRGVNKIFMASTP